MVIFLKITGVSLKVIAGLVLCILVASAAVFYQGNIKEKKQPLSMKPRESCFWVSNDKYLFSSEYIHLWPEYYYEQGPDMGEGAAELECSAKVRSISLAMNWPELTPGNYFSEKFNGIVVTLEPWSIGERGLRETLNHFMSKVSPSERRSNTVVSSSGMKQLELTDAVFPAFPRQVFWHENGNSLEVVGVCRWSAYRSSYHFCHFRYLSENSETIVKIDFYWNELGSWNEIASRVNDFLSNKRVAN